MMSSFLSLRRIKPDLILSSLALRAEETADMLAKKLEYDDKIHYMKDLYRSSSSTLLDTISLQDDKYKKIFMIGHNPELTEFSNYLLKDNIMKIPTLGIIAITFDIDSWEDIGEKKGKLDFFIHPKQFKYYMPKQIQTTFFKEA